MIECLYNGDDKVKLENKIAVVTGGAMGNGAGIVEIFAKYKASKYPFLLEANTATSLFLYKNPSHTAQ